MQLKSISKESFFTPEELSLRLKLSVATVYKLIAKDEIPYFKIGKSYRIPASALIAFMMQEGNLGRFVSRGPVVPEAAKHFIHEIETASKDVKENIIAVVLFGSYARGDFNEDSDIDMLVIVKENSAEVQNRISEISSSAMEAANFDEFLSPMKMSLVHWTESGRRQLPLYEEIQNEGIILWPKDLKSLKDIESVRGRS